MAEPTEDIPYSVSSFATPDPEKKPDDPDRAKKSVLVEVLKYLDEAIETHNSFDSIDLSKEHPLTAEQQIAVAKILVGHLRDVKNTISNKVKEL